MEEFVLEMFDKFEAITAAIETLITEKKRVVIAVDGRCGSGKTTLASLLSEKYHATLFHMDDFFLRAEQRTPERLATPGGNVDYERFIEEIISRVATCSEVELRRFDHATLQPGEPVTVGIGNVVIVEGTYSCHPKLREFLDLKIFVTTEREKQLERIMARSGPEKYEMFVAKWIPLEEMYFSGTNTSEYCDYIVRT